MSFVIDVFSFIFLQHFSTADSLSVQLLYTKTTVLYPFCQDSRLGFELVFVV